ncbi:SDR family oxidoreductase [Alkalihalobacillus macyae]|uniref:SDR family oxidoreductase n=1 Tax=Guptibacillus hwajinpoensis TaxID=208199 RepID=UPI00273B5A1B|nr:SDR family oxidoreductase [Alkalihalobacillus macyae]MDP4551111.1 SDR family oxidoreductase [Alkalihalobacillus macyae]
MILPFMVDLEGKVAVVTGGSGVIGSVIARALASCGAQVAIIARNEEKINQVVTDITEEGGNAIGLSVDVLSKNELSKARNEIAERFGPCDILINGAGGNHPDATTDQEFYSVESSVENTSFFDLERGAISTVFDLNYLGTILPSQVFAKDMINREGTTIINISSMNSYRPLTKIPAYSGAKAAISNLTQWLAVYFSKVGVRVNAIAPGFFLTNQNENLLINEEGSYNERAEKIISQTPMERFGEPEELIGTLLWLVNQQASGFVNGIIVPIDGGFSAYSGV